MPKTYTEDLRDPVQGRTLVTYNLTYDASGRLLNIVSIPAPPILNFVYKYPNASTVTLDLYNSGTWGVHEIFMLNSFGLVDSTFQYNNTNDTSTEKYIYNASKQPIQLNEYTYKSGSVVPYSTTNYTYDNNGNAITEIDDLGDTTINDFYPNLLNNINLGKLFIFQDKNLVKTTTYSSGGTTYSGTHYYTFDSSNRLIEDSAYVTDQNVILIKTYTY
jgi:hypothetical protein